MKIKVHLDKTPFTRKPTGGEIGGIRIRLHADHSQSSLIEIEVESLIDFIRTGCTIQPCVTYSEDDLEIPKTDKNGKPQYNTEGKPLYKKKYNFISQQIFFLDIDNETEDTFNVERIGEVLSENGLCAAIVYHTFSSKPEREKFRVCILLDEPVTDESERDKIIHALFKLFGFAIDGKCTDPPRLFFGSPNSIIWDECGTCSKESVLKLYDKLFPQSEQPEIMHELPLNSTVVTPQLSTYFRGLDKNISPDFDPDVFLDMIDPNQLEYNEWFSVSASYKFYETGTQSFEHWMLWNSLYNGDDRKADERSWNGMTGKGITKGTLLKFADLHSPSEYHSYVDGTNAKSRELKERKATRQFNGNQIAGNNQPPRKKQYHTIRLSEVKPETQEFLWNSYIPVGEITIMFAAGGTGKSFATIGIAADVSAGRTLPKYNTEQQATTPEKVLFISAEDNESIIQSRMKEAGGNLDNCIVLKTPKNRTELKEDSFLLPQNKDDEENIQAFAELLTEVRPRLVIIDPWSVYIGDGKNMNRANDVRGVTNVLTVLAKEFHCAMLIVAHVNKKAQSENANDAVSGSTALIDSARSAICVRSFGADSDRRVMIPTKSNYQRKAKSVCYRIINQGDGKTARFQWDGFSDLTEDDLTAAARSGKKLSDIVNEKQDDEENRLIAIDVIKHLAVYGQSINISYDRFRDELRDECGEDFLPSRPKKFMNSLISDLRACGIGLELKSRVKGILKNGSTDTESRTGFTIHQMNDGNLMAAALPK